MPGSWVPLTDTLTSIPPFSPSLPVWELLCWPPGLLLDEFDEDDEEDCEPGRLALGRLAVLPPWLELVEPGNDGLDEPLDPELLVLGVEGLRELDELELELELGELGLERDEDELLLGDELDDDELDDEAVGIEEDELLDELCCSSQAPSRRPSETASAKGRQRKEPEVVSADMMAVSVFVSDPDYRYAMGTVRIDVKSGSAKQTRSAMLCLRRDQVNTRRERLADHTAREFPLLPT